MAAAIAGLSLGETSLAAFTRSGGWFLAVLVASVLSLICVFVAIRAEMSQRMGGP